MELSEYLHNFRARWKTIVITIIVCVIAAYGISEALPQKFTATALVFVTTDSPKSSSYENSQFSLQRVKSYPSLADSPDVLNPVIAELGLKTTAAVLASKVSASNPANTVYVQVSAEATKPSAASALANSVANHLVVKIKSVEAANKASGTTVQPVVAVPAVAPNGAVFPNTKINLALGLLVGLAIGMLLAMLRIRLDRRIYDAADVEAATGLPLVGMIPKQAHIEKAQARHLKGRARRQTVDPFLDLWTNVIAGQNDNRSTVILLAPSTEKAASQSVWLRRGGTEFIAELGQNVCYVESDSSVTAAFGELAASPGITQVLDNGTSIQQTYSQVKGTSITVIPNGVAGTGVSSEPADGKRNPRARTMGSLGPKDPITVFRELENTFDVVMIQASSDSEQLSLNVLAPLANAVVIVGTYGESSAVALRQTTLELKALGIKAVGVVLLETPMRILRQASDDEHAAPWKVS